MLRRLSNDGRPAVALIRPGGRAANLFGARAAVYDGTIAGLRSILEEHRPESVFHFASAVLGESHSENDVEPLVRSNILLGTQLAESCVKTRTHKFINAGTFFEYRDGTSSYDPVSLYAATKRAFKDILEYYARATPLRALSLCLYDLYGPDDPRPKLLNLLARSASSGETLALSPGDQSLDLLHVDDAAAAFLRAETLLSADPELRVREYCASSGERLNLRALVELFREETGLSPNIHFGGRPYRKREVMHPWAGPALPGWSPSMTLASGLRRVYGDAARARVR